MSLPLDLGSGRLRYRIVCPARDSDPCEDHLHAPMCRHWSPLSGDSEATVAQPFQDGIVISLRPRARLLREFDLKICIRKHLAFPLPPDAPTLARGRSRNSCSNSRRCKKLAESLTNAARPAGPCRAVLEVSDCKCGQRRASVVPVLPQCQRSLSISASAPRMAKQCRSH